MPTAETSSVERRRLRSVLRQKRSDASMTQEQVADAMDWSLSKVIRIETGAVSVSTNDVRGLLNLYGVTDRDYLDEIIGLARAARQRPWWYAYRDHFATGFRSYLDLEAGASALKFFQPSIIPGILQIKEYAAAAIRGNATEPQSAEEFDLELEVRNLRQRAVFERDQPPEVVAVLDEAALRRVCGDATVMRAQLLHLVEMTDRPQVSIRVMPFSGGTFTGNSGPFIILDFDHDGDGPAIYIEGVGNAQVVRADHQIIDPYVRLFDRVRSAALSEQDSLALIHKVADELR